MKNEKVKIDYFHQIGKTTLPDNYREAIKAVFQEFKSNWYTPRDFHNGLKMSHAYAYKVCEGMRRVGLLEKRSIGRTSYYRFKMEER